MRVWRICRKPHANDALNGRGGLFASGRWHTKGRRVIYTSGTLSLATLEVLVHVDHDLMPQDFVQIEIDLPNYCEVELINQKKFPADWRSSPSPEKLQQLGNIWLEEGRTPVLEVPSAVIPEETNFLLNPAHVDAKKITVISVSDFQYDPRLFN